MAAVESFNVLKHDLVPEHRLLSEEEGAAVLAKLGIESKQLPKIKKSDAAIQALEKSVDGEGREVGPIEEGRIIQITRPSKTAEQFVAYRLVIGG